MPQDPTALAHEARWLRDLAADIAADLEVMAASFDQADALRRRAMRIRRRLHEGPPSPPDPDQDRDQ